MQFLKRKQFQRWPSLGVFTLFSLLVLSSNLFAQVQKWDFEKAEDYRFDSEKVQVSGKLAALKKKEAYKEEGRVQFDLGTYENTWSTNDELELIPQNSEGILGPYLPVPVDEDTAGLMAIWHLDEPSGSNVLDSIGRNVAKTNDSEVVSGQTGFNYARLFDGTKSHVFIPNYETFNFAGSFSVESWVRPVSPVKGKVQTLVSRWQTIGSQKSFALQISSEGKLDFLVSRDGATVTRATGETVLSPGRWYHVVGVYTGSEVRVYLNGALDAQPVAFAGPVFQTNVPIYLGAMIDNKMTDYFEGVMDEVAFYSVAVTETQAMNHFGNPQGMVGFWRLDERAGILTDSSSYGHNAIAHQNPDYGVQGKKSLALHLNGSNQYIEVPASQHFGPEGNLTAEFWIKPEKLPGQNELTPILSSVGGQSDYAISLAGPDGRVHVRSSLLSPSEFTGSKNLMLNEWHHVAVTWGEGSLHIYVDGVLDSSATYGGFLMTGKSGFLIGTDSSKSSWFQGGLDDVAIYRRVKSGYEISNTANLFPASGSYISKTKDAGSQAPWQVVSWEAAQTYGQEIQADATGLLHLYHFNEPEGVLLADEMKEIPANTMGTNVVPGMFSKARWFSKKGYDKIISQKTFPSLSTFTVSFWFQFKNAEPQGVDRLFSIGDENPSIYRSTPDGRLHVVSAGAKKIVSNAAILDSRWHYAALASDGRTLFLFMDGQIAGSTPFVRATASEPLVIGNLKSSDTFEGAIDEFALFNSGLDQQEIEKQYLSGKLDVKFLARTSETENFVNSEWRGPKGTNYVEMRPTANTVGLWHFNEKNLRGASNEVTDDSRYGNHGVVYGNGVSSFEGAIHRGIHLNGASDYVEIADSASLHLRDAFTISAWVRPDEIEKEGSRILDKRYAGGSPVFSSFSLDLLPGNRLGVRLGHEGGYHLQNTDQDGEIAVGRWNHVAATYNRKEIRLYINGRMVKSAPFKAPLLYDKGALYLGRYGSGASGFFHGGMDEVLLANEALSDNEIFTLFLKADPDNFYRAGNLQKLDVAPGRYFQYFALLKTNHPTEAPAVKSVSIQGNDYSVDKPAVINGVSVSFADITSFRQRLGPNNKGTITYQISHDGANWFYHNGRHWVIASSITESNTANQVEERIHDFPKDVGIGSFYFKAFLHSPTGIEPVELEAIELEFLPNKLTMTSPNGGEGWLVGSDQTIQWNTAGETATVRLEYSRDNFKKDFQPIEKELKNTGSYRWKVPDTIDPTVKIRVMDSLDPRIYDTSDLSFRIMGALEVVAPNYNERWEVGTKQEITWKALGNMPEVKLEFSTDDFKNLIYPIVDSVKNTGKFTWTIPDRLSKTTRVRISDVRDPKTSDISNDTFAIHGKIEVISPEAGSRFKVRSNQEIRWKTTGTIPTVQLQYAYKKEDGEPQWQKVEDIYSNRGAYVWQVPDQINSDVIFRVSDPNDGKVFAETPNFAIIGAIEVLNPQGGEYWTVGSKRKISWKTVGTISAVNLEYALLDKSLQKDLKESRLALDHKELKWNMIEKAVTNIGTYTWNVPEALMERAVVRVTDAGDSKVGALPRGAFRVIPGFILKTPNGNESWGIGTDHNIEWETKGAIDEVKLEYSKDNFVKDVHTIIDRASNIGRFAWKVPDDAAPKVWVRVSDPNVSQASDTSDAPFRIFASFTFVSPLGGEKYEVGSLGSIQWETKGKIPEVKLEYSHDNFNKDKRVIAASTPNKGQFSWTIPDDIGSGYYFRISDPRDPQAYTISEGAFSIVGKFYLLTPAGGENFVVGTMQNITWKGAGSVSFVRIDYSEDEFTKSFITLAEAAPNNGVFKWEIPNKIGQSFKIRIWDPSHPESTYVMDYPSRIIGGFTLDSPNGGEALYTGEPFKVSWKTFGNVERVKLEFSNDNFTKQIWEVADTIENLGSYSWLVPDVPAGLYKFRVSDAKDSTSSDMSNSDFRIRSRFTLISPTGGEGWAVGEKHQIKWKTSGSVPKVNIEYSTDDFKSTTTIAENVPNTGSYEWTVPNHVAQNIKFRISDVTDPGAYALSGSTMRTQAVLTLEAPQGGEVWRVGQTYPIIWKSTGDIKAVKIEYSRDGFISEAKTIIPTTANIGSYNWTVPDEISKHTKIRVVDLSDSTTQVTSKAPFQIAGSFQVIGPNGGENWHALEKREISWVTMGTIPEVDLSFCILDDKGNCVTNENDNRFIIDKGVLNSGRYIWDIPRMVGEAFKVKVCDAQNPEICDLSDRSFSLTSPFEIVYPRGADLWAVGSDQEIRWHTYGNVSRVMIQYAALESMDQLKDSKPIVWKKLIEGLDNQGHFLFKVPDDISKNIVFKVADWDDEAIFSVTQNPVMFVGTFTLLNPNGGEKWAAGTTQKIVWDTLGSVPNVRLEFSTDQFEHDINPIEATYTNTGNYQWTISPVLGKAVKVRISDASNAKAFDLSDQPFKIMAGFVMLGPDGNEVWKVGSKQKITWKTIAKVEKVKLQYQTGNFEWKNIVDRIPNGGEYEWIIPDDVSKQVTVRVVDDSDPDAWDVSNAPFEIRPDIVVTAPNGKENFFVGIPTEIRWATIGTVGAIKIEYSKDGFVKDAHLIAKDVPDKSPFIWTPSDDITESATIRITSQKNDKVVDVSDHAFSILPQIKVMSPKAGDVWVVGSEHPLEWDWRGTLDQVNIEYSTNDFSTATLILSKVTNTGKILWKVPDQVSSKVKIRVTDSKHPAAFGISPSPLKIVPGYELIQPNGGERWKAGSKQTVQWKTFGTSTKVVLQYGIQNEKSQTEWKPVTRAIQNKGEFVWDVPADISSQVKMRVVDADDPQAFGESKATFKILAQYQWIAPKPNENLFVSDKFEMKWQTIGRVPSVKIEFSSADLVDGQPGKFEPIENIWANQGKYFWTIPDTISEKIRLKISDAQEPDSFLISEPFRIRGRLFGKISEGRINWPVGTTQTIFWKSVGSIQQIDLSYQLPGKSDWKTIIRGVPNTGSYGWLIPDDVSKDVKLRISDSNNGEVFDELKDRITIAARFEFKTPKTGDILSVGSEKEITWNTFGKVQRLWLEYSMNGGDWYAVAGPMEDTGSFKWAVPDAISPVIRLRLRDGDNDEAVSISSDFQIRGVLELLSPIGAEVWGVGTTQTFTWKTTGTISQVKLEFLSSLTDASGTILTQSFLIKENTANQNRFEWVVPDRIADDIKVRISDAHDANVFSESKSPFSIIGTFNLLNPKGDEVWTVASTQQIAWLTRGGVSKVHLEFSRDDFYRDVNVIASNLENSGMIMWKIPDAISDHVTLRVSDANDLRAQVVLEKSLKIIGALVTTVPAADEVWTVGENKAITWTTTGTVPQVRIEFSRDDFQKDIQVIENAVENKGRYEWKVPDVISGSLKFRISNAKDSTVFHVSHPIKVQGRIRLTTLQKHEVLTVLGHRPIQWETTGTIPKVRLEYSRDNFHKDTHIIAANTANTGVWDWQIPDNIGAGVKVRVLDEFNFNVSDVTPEALEIQGALTFLEDSTPKRMAVGSKKDLLWNSTGTIPTVRLEYSTEENFSNPILIADMLKNKGTYLWNIPDNISDRVHVRVIDTRNETIYAETQTPMSIVGVLSLLEPRGGFVTKVGEQQTVRWSTVGTIPQIRLEYSTSDPALDKEDKTLWNLVTGAVDNTGVFQWAVPNDISNSVRLRISDARDPLVSSVSDGTFVVLGSLQLLEPHGRERWIVGTEHELIWNTVGTITHVRLEYSYDGFNKDIQLIQDQVVNTGHYLWKVPDAISDKIQVRVTNASDTRVSSFNQTPFSIIGDFVFLEPEGIPVLKVGSEHKIEWQTIGTIPQIRLEYLMPKKTNLAPSADSTQPNVQGIEPEFRVIQENLVNLGSYDWKIPDSIGGGILIRLSDIRDESINALSQKEIKIVGDFKTRSPKAKDRWLVGEVKKIEWDTLGTVSRVDLEASTDNFQEKSFVIEKGRPNENSYFWQVPDVISKQVTIRVKNSEDPAVYTNSETFQIHGALKILPPQGDKNFLVGEKRRIEWQTIGSIPTVHLDFSIDKFASHSQKIETLTHQNGHFDWEVPDSIAREIWLRVRSAEDPEIFSVLTNPISIQGTLRLLDPVADEGLKVGTAHTLRWNSTGTIPQVRLEYSNDGFKRDRHIIGDQVPNSGSYDWTVPDYIYKSVDFRVASTTDSALEGRIAKPIKIQGVLEMLSLKQDETWRIGDKKLFEWSSSGTIPQIRMEYSNDEFRQDIHVMYEGIPNQGKVQWTVPDDLSGSIRFRISDVRDPEVIAYTKGTANILGSILMITPRGDEELLVGQEATIQWKSQGNIQKVILEYSFDGFQWDIRPISKLATNEGHFNWKVPDTIGDHAQIRVLDAGNRMVYGVSNPFNIRGSIEIIRPVSSDIFRVGSEETIEWTTTGTIQQFRLEYSLDHFEQDIRVINQAVDSSRKERQTYTWQIPDAISDQVWIRVTDAKNQKVHAISAKPFKIKGAFELITPKGGEVLSVGDRASISWKTIGTIPIVMLEMSRDGFKQERQTIISSVKNDGIYEWLVPDAINDRIWVRVVSENDLTVSAMHENPIKIQGKLSLTSPEGGEVWKVGSEEQIQWTNVGSIPEVRLEYSIPNAAIALDDESKTSVSPWYVIQDRLPNRGNYLWRIPDNLPPSLKIRVVDASNPMVYSEAIATVKIEGTIRILTPNKKEKWPVGSKQEIIWDSRGYIPQVKMEYSSDHFRSDTKIAYPLLTNNGRVTWEVPDMLSKDLAIRISDAENASVQSISEFPIEVTGRLRLDAPQGGERWEVGSDHEITWSTIGTISQINLEYSKDQFIRHRQPIRELVPNVGRYVWKIPDDLGPSIWVRVSDSQNINVDATSEQSIAIVGSLYLKRPNGGQIWTVGDTQDIEWDTTGSISRVRLEYSTDDFSSSTAMVGIIPNSGKFEWKIPDVVSNQLKIRVLDAQDDHVFSTSASPVKIQGEFQFISPAAGDFWVAGAQKLISWSSRGTVPYITLEYSVDNFAHTTPVILGLANSGSFNWTVPDLPTDDIQLRITNAQDQTVSKVSPVFHIGGTVQLLTPQGGEVWRVGETQEIRWKTIGTISKVKIDLSNDQFHQDIQTLAAAWDNTGVFAWKVPDMIRSGAQIRISDARNPSIFDVSKGPFKISGDLTLISPQGGESWKVGSRPVIKWKTTGTISSVRLDYSLDNFGTAMPIVTETANTESYEWQIPDIVGSEVKVRVSDASDPMVSTSMNYAAQVEGGFKLVQPVGGEVFSVGDEQMISWTTIGTIPNINLDYSEDDFVTVKPIVMGAPNRGSHLWTIPSLSTRNLKIRITDSRNPNIFDVMATASEVFGEMKVMSPKGGEIYLVGSELPIRWQSAGKIDEVRIECSTDHFRNVFPVINSTPNTGEYLWKVPDLISRQAVIRVIDANHPQVTASTLDTFEIRGVLGLVSPAGGEVMAVNQTFPIAWQTRGTIPQVRLEYSRDNFEKDVQIIAPNLANKGSYSWDVPITVGGDIKIRVLDNKNPEVSDTTRASVRVVGKIDLIYPTWSETFQVGERIDIQWRSSPNVGTVKLEYTTNDFNDTEIISSAAPNTGKFSWTIPDKIGDQLKIRISDSQNATVFAVSKNPFRIRGALRLIFPAGGEVWSAGSTHQITWTTGGTVPEVRLEYSGDDFVTAEPIISKTPNTGSYDWKIPEINYRNIRVRVIYLADQAVQSASVGSVKILGQLKMVSPNGGERWIAGEERTIRWQTLGNVPRVSIEYSKDDFVKDVHLIASDIPNIGSQFWTIPNDRSNQLRVRVRSHQDSEIYAVSGGPFQIDHYHIRWVIKDAHNQDHLTGLVLTDSAGQTQAALTSPVTIDRPYGIYTTVWSKPGYKEFKSTWVADNDRTFAVMLEKTDEALEQPRINFHYDDEKDLMKITSWFEREGKTVPAVIYSEVRIYEGAQLLYTLNSSNPDSEGRFYMVWDTSAVAGNTRYLASASITLANSKVVSSPVNFQLDIPVKRDRALVSSSRAVRYQNYLPAPAQEEEKIQPQQKEKEPKVVETQQPKSETVAETVSASLPMQENQSESVEQSRTKDEESTQEFKEARLMAPDKAVMRETVSIQYFGAADSRPVIDVYDSNRKLIVRGASMREEEIGRYAYMLPITGLGFIPGKPITVSIIERKTGNFKTKNIMIESSSSALGLSRQVGETTILEILQRLDYILIQIKQMESNRSKISETLSDFERVVFDLATNLSQESLNENVLDKLNKVSFELGRILGDKGFDGTFLTQTILEEQSNLSDVNEKVRQIQAAIAMLTQLYRSSGLS